MLGLIYFQYYWIKSVLEANEERFQKDVREALVAVSTKLEKKEVLDVTFDNLSSRFKWQIATGDREVEMIESTFEKRIVDLDSLKQNPPKPELSFKFENGKVSSIETEDDYQFIIFDQSGNKHEHKWEMGSDSRRKSIRSERLHESLQKAVKKSEMVQVVIQELLTTERSINNRIEKADIDSLLHQELVAKGIDIPYEFGVYEPISAKMIMQSANETNPDQLLDTELRASLFPNDIIGEVSELLVIFPDQQSFLFRKIWLTLSSSVFLVLIIVFCFSYAIYTILRQKKLSEIKNDFINNMTHEFKTPISTVSLACEALQDVEVGNSPGLKERYLKIISDENTRLGLQVEKVLQMAVIERKDFKLKKEKVDVHAIIDKVLENVAIQVSRKGGTVHKELKARQSEVEADEMHLTNIIYNLLDNANKYSPELPEITIQTHDTRQGIAISVKDRGIGMSRDQVNKIFERFYRIPTGNVHDVKGFGLGLAYVKRVVDAHQGEIHVKSEPYKGSTFEIFIPAHNGKN